MTLINIHPLKVILTQWSNYGSDFVIDSVDDMGMNSENIYQLDFVVKIGYNCSQNGLQSLSE